jgi:DNA-directed RNA polymerase specialized sigma24 family protein
MISELTVANQSLFLIQPNLDGAEAYESLKEIFELVASGLYSLASMLVGEGEESARLVEETIASVQVSPCADPQNARRCSRRALATTALEMLAARCPGCLAAPQGLAPASTCIEGDDLASAGLSSGELESMISGTERERVREWLASLPTWMRTVFALRAVAGFNAAETAALLKLHGGAQAAGWTTAAVSEVFRQGLCSLASQVLHASAGR